MGQLVFQATLGGQVNLVGPNTASTFNLNVPAVAGTLVTTGDTGTVTNTMLAGSIANAKLLNSSVTVGSTSIALGATSTTLAGLTSVGSNLLTSAASTALTLQSAGTTAVTIDTSQNVLVGTGSTTVPLTITKNPSSSSASIFYLNPSTGTNASLIGFNNSGSGGLNIGRSDSAGAGSGTTITAYDSFVATTGTTGLSFHTNNTRAMYIDSGQNVGIGTTSPATRFDVRCASDVTQDIAYFSRPDGAVRCKISLDGSGIINFGTSTSHPLAFLTANTEQMRIDSAGRIQVAGTTVVDSGRISVTFNSANSTGVSVKASAVAGGTISTYWNSVNTTVGSITTNGATVAYNTTSDYRLKENVSPMTGALDTVSQLKPVTYKWKQNGSNGQGFIAHELQSVVPDCVNGEKDATREEEYEVTPAVKDEQGNITTPAVMGTRSVPSYQGIDTSFLVATLTAAIQELKAINDTQAETITALTARVVALEAK